MGRLTECFMAIISQSVRCRRGEAVTVFDGRPNSELILATGRVEDDSPSDYLTISVGLVQADRMFSTKKEILQAMGFNTVQVRMSLPLLKRQRTAAKPLAWDTYCPVIPMHVCSAGVPSVQGAHANPVAGVPPPGQAHRFCPAGQGAQWRALLFAWRLTDWLVSHVATRLCESHAFCLEPSPVTVPFVILATRQVASCYMAHL